MSLNSRGSSIRWPVYDHAVAQRAYKKMLFGSGEPMTPEEEKALKSYLKERKLREQYG